jgi:hypothetical protein
VQAVLARVRSGEADLAGLDPRTTVAIRSALAVDPRRRATPAEVLAELRRAAHGDVEVDGTGATQVLAGGATRVLPSGPPRRTPQDADSTAVLDTVDATPTQQAPGWYRADEQEDDRTAVLERDSDPYDAYPPAYEDDEPYDTAYDDPDIPAPYLAPVPARRTGTVAAVGAALVALAATRPGVALTVAVALAVLARGVGVAVGGVHARRARRGERSGDVPWAVVGAPWYLLRGVLGVLPAALVAASAVVVLGGVAWWLLGSGRYVLAEPAPGTSAGQLPGNAAWVVPAVLAVIGLLGLVTLWFGPMMRPTRLGARWTLQAVAPGQAGAVVVVVVALALAAVLAYSAVQGAPPVWWPLPGPPQIG